MTQDEAQRRRWTFYEAVNVHSPKKHIAWTWSVLRRAVRKDVGRPFIRKDWLGSNSDVKSLNQEET